MNRTYHRKNLGPHFSEGSRLLWTAMDSFASMRAFAKAKGVDSADVHAVAYGDKAGGLDFAIAVGIDPSLFRQKPKAKFSPPAARPRPSQPPHRPAA